MSLPKLTRLELQIMETVWERGAFLRPRDSGGLSRSPPPRVHHDSDHGLSFGDQEGASLRQEDREREHLRRGYLRDQAQRTLIDELLSLFGGRTKPVMAHLVDSGKLTLEDVKEAEEALRKRAREDKSK